MKEPIKIYVCKNRTDDSPDSYRLKVKYKDKFDNMREKETFPRFKNKKEAQKQKTQWALDYANDEGFFAPPKEEPKAQEKTWTFREFAQFYWNDKKDTFAEKSRPNRKSEVDGIVKYFKDTQLKEIDLMAVSAFKHYIKNKTVRVEVKVKSKERVYNPETKRKRYIYTKKMRETPRSSSSINHYLIRLRAMLQVAEDFGFIEKVPKFRGIIETANDNKRDFTITFEELDRLVAAVSKRAEHLKLFLIAAFETGAREIELKEVKREDIDFENKTALVLNSKRRAHKRKTYRIVYFSDYLRQALIDAGKDKLKPDEFVFSQTDLKNPYKRARRLSGINPNFTMKDLRHCLPTHLAMCGVDEMIIERQIGHNIKGLLKMIYINMRQDFLVAEMQKYEEFSRKERAKIKVNMREATDKQSVVN